MSQFYATPPSCDCWACTLDDEISEDPSYDSDDDKYSVANSKSEPVLPCETPETHSADFMNELQRPRKHSRSQEKRNTKFSKAYLNSLLENRSKEERLTHLRQRQRQSKHTRWDNVELPSSIPVAHNNRRLKKFLEEKITETEPKTIPNGYIRRLFVRCCAPKDDSVYKFLTSRCKLGEYAATALTPIIKAIQKLFVNKITIGIALAILGYYLARYIDVPPIVFTPIIALILGYLIRDIGPDVIDALTTLYTKLSQAFKDAKEYVTHITDTQITQSDYSFVNREIVVDVLCAQASSKSWRKDIAQRLYDASKIGTPDPWPKSPFSLSVPSHVFQYLSSIEKTELKPLALKELLESEGSSNGFSTYFSDISTEVSSLLHSTGLVPKDFKFPTTLKFYTSSRKFIKELHTAFSDLYPYIYEYTTGRKYIDPTVAKYLDIFGTIAKKVHITLKTARQSNIVRESADFRLKIITEYEELQDTQLKLLELKAPPQYMQPLNSMIREMSNLANECYSRTRGEAHRDEPVLVFLRGPPGTGKTTINYALALIIGERLQRAIDLKADFFHREPGTEFWEGYENQFFTNFDDAFQLKKPEAQAITILEAIKVKNSAPYKLLMANIEAKKNSFFNSQFVFFTTNVENVVCDQIEDIGAFYRRLDFDVQVLRQPLPNVDGSLSFDYDILVNGQECDITRLADSIVALYKTRIKDDARVAKELLAFAKKQPVTHPDLIIPARNSSLDFHGKSATSYQSAASASGTGSIKEKGIKKRTVRANGLKSWISSTFSSVRENSVLTPYVKKPVFQFYAWAFKKIMKPDTVDDQVDLEHLSQECANFAVGCMALWLEYAKWVAVGAISYTAVCYTCQLIKNFTTTIYPNSRKEKDKLTGDKPTKTTAKAAVQEQLKAVQAKLDKKVVAKTTQNRANSSCSRWSAALIDYIEAQGWQNEKWVQDSLASIKFSDDMVLTQQEEHDIKHLKSNVVSIRTRYEYRGDTFEMYGKALILNENHLITVGHQIPQNCPVIHLTVEMHGRKIDITNCEIKRFEDADTCVVKLSTLLPCRDITYMLAPISELTAKDSDLYLLRNFDDVLTLCPVKDFAPTDRVIKYHTDHDEIVRCGEVFDCKVAVCVGDSGCFYVVRDHGRFKIVGMHVASGPKGAHGRFISREMLKDFIKPPRKAKVPYDYVVKTISEHSRSFDEELACNSACIPIGIVSPRTSIASRSKIARSMLYRHKSLGTLTEFPVVMKRTFDEEDPLLNADSKFRIRPEPYVEEEFKEECVEAFLDEYPNTTTSTFYSNAEAFEGNFEMPKLDMKTSSGYHYSAIGKTPKSQLEVPDLIEITHQADDLLEDAYNDIMPLGIFQTSFKDEIREFPKVKTPRVINCAPTALTILFRRVLGPLMNMLHKSFSHARTKVGINAHGDDWKTFYNSLVDISPDNIVELDYRGYEYNHPQFGYQIIAEFVYRLYKRSGFSERDAKVAKLLILSCAGGYVIQNDILIFVWMLLSGLPITAELNSLLNEVYQMFAYKRLTSQSLIDMRSKVASGFYGDDLLHSVAESLKEKFNAITIQKFCKEVLLMDVTPASNKSGDLVPFVSILECSFLGRKFAPRENRVDAPIKLQVCTNSLNYYVPVSHMTQRELLSAKCRSFITELTHYPEPVYAYWYDILKSLKAQYELTFVCYDYSTALARRLVDPESDF